MTILYFLWWIVHSYVTHQKYGFVGTLCIIICHPTLFNHFFRVSDRSHHNGVLQTALHKILPPS